MIDDKCQLRNLLTKLRENKQPPFPVEKRGFYHIMMSLIISQKIRFSSVYTLQETGSLDEIMNLTPEQRKEVGLSQDKWTIMHAFDQTYDFVDGDSAYDYSIVNGIGEWTCQCARIMVGDYSVGFIVGDLAARRKLGKELEMSAMTPQKVSAMLEDCDLDVEEQGELFSILWNWTRTT